MRAADRSGQPVRVTVSSYEPVASRFSQWRSSRFDAATAVESLTLPPAADDVGVDAGCGSGLLALQLARHCRRLIALDASLSMLLLTRDAARAAGADNIRLVLGDVCHPPLRRRSAAFVVASFVLHLTDVNSSLPALGAVLAPGGALRTVDVAHRFPRLMSSAAGHAWQDMTRPLAELLRGRPVAAVRLARLLWSRSWRAVGCRPALGAAAFRTACERHLPGCAVTCRRKIVRVRWTAPGGPGR